jgi:hypothetical protein
MIRFNRQYKLFVQTANSQVVGNNIVVPQNGYLLIQNPFTIEFDITRDTSATVNQAIIKVYNLNPTNRNLIFKDRYSMVDNGSGTGYKEIILEVGYNNQYSTVFRGQIQQAYSYRNGVDMITYIQAFDGGYATSNANITQSFAAGTLKDQIFDSLSQLLPNISKNKYTPSTDTIQRGVTYNGNIWNFLQRDYQNEVFIDNGTLYKLKINEGTKALIQVISAETGLLATPLRQNTNLTAETILEPRVQVGNIVELNSTTNPSFNGQYKVIGIKHSGIISESVGGDCKTTLQLFIGSYLFGNLITIE